MTKELGVYSPIYRELALQANTEALGHKWV